MGLSSHKLSACRAQSCLWRVFVGCEMYSEADRDDQWTTPPATGNLRLPLSTSTTYLHRMRACASCEVCVEMCAECLGFWALRRERILKRRGRGAGGV